MTCQPPIIPIPYSDCLCPEIEAEQCSYKLTTGQCCALKPMQVCEFILNVEDGKHE